MRQQGRGERVAASDARPADDAHPADDAGPTFGLELVSEAGIVVRVPMTCAMEDTTLELPAEGRRALSAHYRSSVPSPCTYPSGGGSGPMESYEIDAVAFE